MSNYQKQEAARIKCREFNGYCVANKVYQDDGDDALLCDTEPLDENLNEDMEIDYDDGLHNMHAIDEDVSGRQDETRAFVYNAFPEAERTHHVQLDNSFSRTTFKWPNERVGLAKIKRMREAELPYKRPSPTDLPAPDALDPSVNTLMMIRFCLPLLYSQPI